MKSFGSVTILHPQDSLNNHNHHPNNNNNKLPTPNKFNHSHSQNPSFTNTRRPTKGIRKKNNGFTDLDKSEFFAGSVLVDSPPPSSVPIPGFFMKNHDPTTELRRILGLSLS